MFVEYILKNALISKYEVAVEGQSERRPIEKLTISFLDVEIKYTPYADDGTAMPAVAVGFDTARNEKH